ncbi:MAG: MBL fold metallo-hydrolase [Candidatus Nealsonbacteria bacterium]|nr:MBL fold metallo-hydrolase [Candidatus Nealsonbacteria bacterium]
MIKRLVVGSLSTNCYLILSNGESAIIDPGAQPGLILREIEDAKTEYIILTHAHFDHTGGVGVLKRKLKSEVLAHEKEVVDFKVDRRLKENDVIKIGEESLRVVHTPGHTPGSICLSGDDFMLTGDTLFYQGFGRTDLQGGSMEQLKSSLKKLDKLLIPGMKVYPGHGPSFIYEENSIPLI